MVDDDFIAAVGTERCERGLRDSLAGFDVADDGSIFCVVAVCFVRLVIGLRG